MSTPALHFSNDPLNTISADVLVVGVRKGKDGPELLSDNPELAELGSALVSLGVTGVEDEVRRVTHPNLKAGVLALVGVGAEVNLHSLRHAAGSVARQILGVEQIAIALPIDSEAELAAIAEGLLLGAYSFTEYKSVKPERPSNPAATFTIVTSEPSSEEIVARARAVSGSVHLVRDLVNTPPSDLYPETFAKRVTEVTKDLPLTVTVLDEDGLREGGFGGILGVGSGSNRGPRLVKIEYSPAEASKHLALVGKGITFDSGGLSLKPASSMVGMKYDMTGAASVLAVIVAAAKLQLPTRITSWLCLAENMPSGTAIRPNDVLRIRGGKTVEVLNTDAEGRLVLADGLSAASEENPDAIVDVATLTGAARIALGDRYTGVMGDDSLVNQILAVAKETDERFWGMPLPSELRSGLNSDTADIANVRMGNSGAGMLIAGVFLKEFVGVDSEGNQIPWAHLDIAGPANNEGSPYGFTGKGPTGVTVRTLIGLATQLGE